MAWLLRFDGVNDYLSYPSPVGNGIANAGDDNQHWELEFETTLDNPSSTYVYRPIESTAISRVELLFRKSDGLVRFVSPASGQYQWTGIDLSAPVIKMKLTKPLGVRELQVSINDGPAVSDAGGDNSCDFDVFGVNSSNGWLQGDLSYIKFTDFITPANNLFSNAASSGGTGQILPDDIGSNDANLINFPTDNSQWISTGGSPLAVNPNVINSSSISLNPSITFASELNINPQVINSNSNSLDPVIEFKSTVNITSQLVNSNSSSLDPAVSFSSAVNISPQAINSSSISLNPTISFTSVLSVTPSTTNSNSESLNPLIDFSSALIVNPQTVNSTSNSLNPNIEFISELFITPNTINSDSKSNNPTIIIGDIDRITDWSAGFKQSNIGVSFKSVDITSSFKINEITVRFK
jgi:hypothetical protein